MTRKHDKTLKIYLYTKYIISGTCSHLDHHLLSLFPFYPTGGSGRFNLLQKSHEHVSQRSLGVWGGIYLYKAGRIIEKVREFDFDGQLCVMENSTHLARSISFVAQVGFRQATSGKPCCIRLSDIWSVKVCLGCTSLTGTVLFC